MALEKARAAASVLYPASQQPSLTTTSTSLNLNLTSQSSAASLAAALTQSHLAAAAAAARDLSPKSPIFPSALFQTTPTSPPGKKIYLDSHTT